MTSERDIAIAYREAIIELAGNIRDADRLKRLYKLATLLWHREEIIPPYAREDEQEGMIR